MNKRFWNIIVGMMCCSIILATEPSIDNNVLGEGDELESIDDIDDEVTRLDWQQVRLEGDTLFISGDYQTLPRRLVVVSGNGEVIYRLMPKMFNDTLKEHPADSIYRHIWVNSRVNPYQVSIDSLPDSTLIPMKGFCRPHPGYITSKHGWRKYRFHYGTDIKVQVGDSIRAAWDGQVRIVGWDPRGYGYYVVIRHYNGLETVYGHLSMPLYDENEPIKAGDVLGLGGNTGRSTGSHLHWEIRYLGNAINPELIMDFQTGKLLHEDNYVLSRKKSYPQHDEMKAAQQASYHKVRSGDTLSGIAKKYHTRVSTLCKLNRLKETSILQIGQRIRVR